LSHFLFDFARFSVTFSFVMKTLSKKVGNQIIEAHVRTERYFSVTGSVWEGYKSERTWSMGGCIHDIVAKHFPQVRSLIPLHLSDLEGVPMHALANGHYWVSGCVDGKLGQKWTPEQSQAECREILKNHFRITDEEAGEVISLTVHGGKESLSAWVEQRKAVWKVEAVAALSLIAAL
jgi:hypothetical protein